MTQNAEYAWWVCPGCHEAFPTLEVLPPGHEHCLCESKCDEFCTHIDSSGADS